VEMGARRGKFDLMLKENKDETSFFLPRNPSERLPHGLLPFWRCKGSNPGHWCMRDEPSALAFRDGFALQPRLALNSCLDFPRLGLQVCAPTLARVGFLARVGTGFPALEEQDRALM
jgi:hypothetical protein